MHLFLAYLFFYNLTQLDLLLCIVNLIIIISLSYLKINSIWI